MVSVKLREGGVHGPWSSGGVLVQVCVHNIDLTLFARGSNGHILHYPTNTTRFTCTTGRSGRTNLCTPALVWSAGAYGVHGVKLDGSDYSSFEKRSNPSGKGGWGIQQPSQWKNSGINLPPGPRKVSAI